MYISHDENIMTVKQTLEQKIREANDAYWSLNNPVISDADYDKLVESLRKLDPKNPLLTEIGKAPIGGIKVDLWVPHLSLGKTYNQNELIAWAKKVARSPDERLMVSPKYDGVTVVQQGDTLVGRGNGYVGQSMTHLANQIGIIYKFSWNDEAQQFFKEGYAISGILDHADEKETCTGELCIPMKKFTELKETYPEVFKEYKNCRNFIAGFANSKSDSVLANLRTKKGSIIHIGDFVCHRAYEEEISVKDLEDPRTLQRLERILRDFQGYPTDGLVFRLKDEKYASSLGETAHHPRGAIALKWTAQQLPGVIKSVEWDIGNERLTPVAILEEPLPFDDGGHTVNRATLHCAKWIQEHHAGVGSKVIVEYAGGVIPKVVDVTFDEKVQVELPKSCPYCGGRLEMYDSDRVCTGDNCTGKIVNKILHGLEVFGLKGVGPALANKVVTELYISNIMEWMTELGSRSQVNIDLLRKKGFTDNEILILTRCAETTEAGVTPIQLLMSVCIPKCGRAFAQTIEEKCGGIEHLIQIVPCDAMYDKIVHACNLSSTTNFMVWMENHKEEFVDYMSLFKIVHPDTIKSYRGVICMTGAGPRPRKQLEQELLQMGYRPTENINEATMLICEDPSGSSSKLKKALKRRIPIQSYENFFQK